MQNTIQLLKSFKISGLIGCTFAALVLYVVYVGGLFDATQFLSFNIVDFNYQVMCPINSQTMAQYGTLFGISQSSSSNLYVVTTISQNVSRTLYDPDTGNYINTTTNALYYCGLARAWNGTCANAQLVCSAPAPMFYLPVKK